MSKYQFCLFCLFCLFCRRLRAEDRYWRRATSGTAVPMHHGNSCASGSLVVCPKKNCCAAAMEQQNGECERQPARRKCAEDARVTPARKVFSSLRKAPSSLVSAQNIAPSFSLATGGDSCEHRALAGRWRKRLSGRPCSMRPAGRARSLARLAGRLAAAEPIVLAHAALEHTF
jgi:hypothetical protein